MRPRAACPEAALACWEPVAEPACLESEEVDPPPCPAVIPPVQEALHVADIEVTTFEPKKDTEHAMSTPRLVIDPTSIRRWLIGGWGLATLILALGQATRIIRFCKRLADAVPAPDWLVEEAEQLGSQLRVHVPELLAVPGLGTPMLWCLGRPKLLLPVHMIKSIGVARWRGILAHELAHLRRGDHWVSRLELGRPGLVVEPALLARSSPPGCRGRARLRCLGRLDDARGTAGLCRGPLADLFQVFHVRLTGPSPGGRRLGPLL